MRKRNFRLRSFRHRVVHAHIRFSNSLPKTSTRVQRVFYNVILLYYYCILLQYNSAFTFSDETPSEMLHARFYNI